MQRKWQVFVKDYLTFSRKDRISLLIILILGVVIYFSPRYFKKKREPYSHAQFQQELSQLKITIDSSRSFTARRYDDDDHDGHFTTTPYRKEPAVKGELFAFDPNTLDEAGWKRLGLRERTIQTIMKFTGKGFKFRQPEDIRKIYGLRTDEADRLIPYIRIADNGNSTFGKQETPVSTASFTSRPTIANVPRTIDINEADTTALIALPGIGSKLAARIINFRDKLGGFARVEQVAETYALPDSTYMKIKDRLVCRNPNLRTFNINQADVNLLKSHPYLKWNIANAIVAYRQQHGSFKKIEDLKKIDIISNELFDKLAPYVVVAEQ
ncbi:ComEA family DNA-binding protein [Aridibaculum aurantiacum]|uniref:ComEA family DNA-binding protein n=1 Tax=Aridibaculum aurantiacum TaxID=2810307 RepID=UPI001A968F34|nr:helix-hairpin-helix domain-containing protein [Aridibaculum aurantiacum]